MSSVTISESASSEDVRHLYDHTHQTQTVFLDWRHRVVTFWFASVSALVTVAGWMFEHQLGRGVAAPLALAAVSSFMAVAMDARNQSILDATYEIGEVLEKRLGLYGAGPVTALRGTRPWSGRLTYKNILRVACASIGLLMTGFSLGFALWG